MTQCLYRKGRANSLISMEKHDFYVNPRAAYNSGVLPHPMHAGASDPPLTDWEEDAISADAIQAEVRRILASRHFRTSRRGKEFLKYVVDETLDGNGHLLKERLIGTNLFGRKPDYGTGEDPVVRVQAGDVRRRLESYNSEADADSEVMIRIPVGSYAPEFLRRKVIPTPKTELEGSDPVTSATGEPSEASSGSSDHHSAEIDIAPGSTIPTQQEEEAKVGPASEDWRARHTGRAMYPWFAVAVLAVATVLAFLITAHIRQSPEGMARAFWAPAASPKPVLICLPRPIVYRPSAKLYDEYAANHPGTFLTRESRRDQVLPLTPTDQIRWGDMQPVRNSGPGIGAVVAAVNIGKLLAEQGIRFELRFGEEATYADMRDSPVVLVGGINTEWATQLTSGAAFIFDESLSSPSIHETAGLKRVWKMESSNGTITRDFGVITRQSSGKTGQFLVQVAGLSHFGTQAASEFLANKKEFSAALHSRAMSLQEKNLQIVVSTEITAGRAGPPHVEAAKSW